MRQVDHAKELEEFLRRFDTKENAFLNHTRLTEDGTERNILKAFLLAKRSEGCSIDTLATYFTTIRLMLADYPTIPIDQLSGADIKAFLIHYQVTRSVANQTLDNMRRNLCSFFNYLLAEDYITKDPMRKIHRIKADAMLKLPFTDEELEKIRDACKGIRDRAMIDFLYCTGVRVSELIDCDRDDIDLQAKEGIIYGKGGKQRIVYLDTRTKLHLEKYLSLRRDDHPALFVTYDSEHPDRLTKSGVEYIVRYIGIQANVVNVHPHRFRRTLATNLLTNGMPLEQVQLILGHSKLDTTLIYAKVNQSAIKINHERYV